MKYSPRVLINYVVFAFLFTGASLLIIKTALSVPFYDSEITSAETENHTVQIIIDPGHGGEDGGASVENSIEKNLNLSISKCIYDIYSVFGYNSRLTRTEDTMLYDYYNDLDNYRGKRKTYDLRNRLRLAEESGAELFVGVHMNKFPQEKYKGLQTYYSPNTSASQKVATVIQSYSKKYLMPENNREIKKATQSIYILNKITIPAVLIECGFLSNPEERALLESSEYQQKIAAVVFSSTAEYLCGK